MAEHVLAVERAYVAVAMGGARPVLGGVPGAGALAAAGAVASHFLAVGTPRSLALIGSVDAVMSLAAHRTWFSPSDIRCTNADTAKAVEGRVVPVAEALTADIVCIHEPMSIAASQLRRGTHVNALAAVTIDDDLRAVATITDEPNGLPALAAGLVDGRQLDEITIFFAGDAAIAAAALAHFAP